MNIFTVKILNCITSCPGWTVFMFNWLNEVYHRICVAVRSVGAHKFKMHDFIVQYLVYAPLFSGGYESSMVSLFLHLFYNFCFKIIIKNRMIIPDVNKQESGCYLDIHMCYITAVTIKPWLIVSLNCVSNIQNRSFTTEKGQNAPKGVWTVKRSWEHK